MPEKCVIIRSVSKVHDEWFADEKRVRDTVGILDGPVIPIPDDGREVISLTLIVFSLCTFLALLTQNVSLTHLNLMFSLLVEYALISLLLKKFFRLHVVILSALHAGLVRLFFIILVYACIIAFVAFSKAYKFNC